MSSRVRLALLGVAHPHADDWQAAWTSKPGAELAAVWDHDAKRGAALADRYGVSFEPDLQALLARDDLNAVGICAENAWHADLTMAAAGAGKHILCEKPPATTLADCDRMRAAVDAASVTYMQALPMRLDPANHKVKELIESGAVGPVSSIRKRHGNGWAVMPIPDRFTWFAQPEMAGGGAFLDEGIHAADFLRWMLGRPISVTAVIDRLQAPVGVDDNGVAIYRFESGAIGVLQSAWTWSAATVCTEVFGETGTIIQHFTDGASNAVAGEVSAPLQVYRREGRLEGWQYPKLPIHFPNNHKAVAARFIDCLQTAESPPSTLAHGRDALVMILAAYRSAKEGRTVAMEEVEAGA
jgi:predicted dehydrogenase